MTSIAFIAAFFRCGGARRGRGNAPGHGIAVFSGMIGVTLFGLFLTPVFMSP